MIGAKDEEKLPLLHLYAKSGNLSEVISLLSGGYSINMTSVTRKETALHLAVQVISHNC
jgi:hypothetical protein